ncbi:MAG: hypothetical protein GF308_09735 [Candidatus Heimdallarchaeota archaeon]|nr:hypothetical protein [Candidatus Heimdallarchaeota archaeon]
MVNERRLRIMHDDSVKEGELLVHSDLKEELDIKTKAEIVVAKRRFNFKVRPRKTIPENKIFGNPEELTSLGIQDNSIATIRAPLD